MNDAKYIGLDVHQATITVAVRDSRGNLVMEAILETKAETILQFIRGLRGSLYVAFEEGTWAACLHDLLQPHAARVLASDPRKNALLRQSPAASGDGLLSTQRRAALSDRRSGRRTSWLPALRSTAGAAPSSSNLNQNA